MPISLAYQYSDTLESWEEGQPGQVSPRGGPHRFLGDGPSFPEGPPGPQSPHDAGPPDHMDQLVFQMEVPVVLPVHLMEDPQDHLDLPVFQMEVPLVLSLHPMEEPKVNPDHC